MPNDLISRDAAHKFIGDLRQFLWTSPVSTETHHTVDVDDVQFGLDRLPAIDAVPVAHGSWIPTDMGGGEPDEAYVCSVCQEPWVLESGTPADNKMNYCPTCGARMDAEQFLDATKLPDGVGLSKTETTTEERT